jgi:hypothetical protein
VAELGAVVLRHGTVLPMDVGRSVLTDTDVLVVGTGSPRSASDWRRRPERRRSTRPEGS